MYLLLLAACQPDVEARLAAQDARIAELTSRIDVAFSMGPEAMKLVPTAGPPTKPIGVAVITRGVGIGRVFAIDIESRVYEVPRVPTERVGEHIDSAEWVGGS